MQPDVFPRVFEVVQELKEVAAKYGKTPGQTGLRWLLDQEGITAVSVGVSKPEQQRLADVSWPLSEGLELWDTLWGWHTKNPYHARPHLYKATYSAIQNEDKK